MEHGTRFSGKQSENVKKPQYKELFLWKITSDFMAKLLVFLRE